MGNKSRKPLASNGLRRKRVMTPKGTDEEEGILRQAIIYLIRKHGMLLVPTAIREELRDGVRSWIMAVTLRYPTGHEGYIGDLLYNGEEFTFLTEESVRKERAKQIANDPEGQRLWDEYRASTVSAGKTENLCSRLPSDGLSRVRNSGGRKRNRGSGADGGRGDTDR